MSPNDRPTVLVVDDEPKLKRLVRLTFAEAGYEVLYAADGEAGVEMVEEERPDLVLLDVHMPRLDGLQACRRIREFSTVPIIMLTAANAETDRIAGLDLGADDYVAKPFSPDELLARARAVMRRVAPRVTPDRALDDGTLRVDLAQYEVTLHGETVALTRTEMRLLAALAESPGRVLMHEEIKRRVWGDEYAASDQQLRTYVKYVRRKIEPDGARPRYLLSHPGVGYSLRLRVESGEGGR